MGKSIAHIADSKKQRIKMVLARQGKLTQNEENTKFPGCRGTFDTCPTEEELNSFLEKKLAPRRCGRCPVFHESKVKGVEVEPRKLTPEEIEELPKVF